SDSHGQCNAVRSSTPVWLSEFYALPDGGRPAEKLRQANALVFGFELSQAPPRIEQAHEAMNVGMFCEQRPIEPAGFVILTIRIVVPALAASRFITHQHHRHADGEHRDGQKILYLAVPEFLYAGIIGRTFNAAVPASVIVRAVPVAFAVFFVVF